MLAHTVPANGGGGRVRIDKTYEDAQSYFVEGDEIAFHRPLGIKRNAVVLPAGYELVACNFPSQVLEEPDGRTFVSFWNATPAEAPSCCGRAARPSRRTCGRRCRDPASTSAPTRIGRSCVSFGSTVAQPSARNLDTGEDLTWEVLRGADIVRAGIAVASSTPEVVVFRFPAVPTGGSTRLRMFETYTDTARYKLVGDELVWDRSFGRPANAAVLPPG